MYSYNNYIHVASSAYTFICENNNWTTGAGALNLITVAVQN